jgi:pyruvate/2-oxoglutarate dehydrogenase complex dihydrolipoamide dehydrogenase (E3) component
LHFRALLDEEVEGFVKIHVQEGTDKILGATIVSQHAGDMIRFSQDEFFEI